MSSVLVSADTSAWPSGIVFTFIMKIDNHSIVAFDNIFILFSSLFKTKSLAGFRTGTFAVLFSKSN